MSVQPALRPAAPHPAHRPAAGRLRLARRPPRPRRPRRGPHAGIIERPRLVGPLLDDSRALAAIVAPAGYGKTTLLEQWSAQDPRPVAWVALTAADDHPRRLVETIARALSEIQPLPAEAVAPWAEGVDLARALGALPPAVLVLDDLHVLRCDQARAVVAELAAQVPPGTTLAVASRQEPALPLGRLRAGHELVEVRSGELGLTRAEAVQALHAAGVVLAPALTARLLELTAGWPAALRLAIRAVASADRPDVALEAFGEDSIVGDYVREEVLEALDDDDRTFLLRASVLDALDAPPATPCSTATTPRRGCGRSGGATCRWPPSTGPAAGSACTRCSRGPCTASCCAPTRGSSPSSIAGRAPGTSARAMWPGPSTTPSAPATPTV